jgi:glycosyltransferase involved in cell wall biosynthesis
MIDADERLDDSFKRELRVLAASGRSKAYAFAKYNYWERMDQIRVDSWWFPNYSYKLWKNNEGILYENKARHCQPIVSHLQLPDVLAEKTLKNERMFSDRPIHHLHYLSQKVNELGLYRANEKDVRSIQELAKGLKTKTVPPLNTILNESVTIPFVIDRNSQELKAAADTVGLIPNAPHAAFFMENFPFYSGGRYHLYQEAYALAKAGVNVWMISNNVPVYVNDFPKLAHFRISDGWQIPAGIKFSLVVGTPSNCGERARSLAATHQAKLVLVSLETPNFIREYRKGTDSTEEYWADFKAVLPLADLVLASAKLPAKYLKDWVKIPEDRIAIMPPAINEYALKKVGKIKKTNTLVFISRIVEHKHLDKLLIAIARLQKQMADPPILDIIGQGSSEKVQKLLKETGVQGRFFSNVSDIAKFQLIGRAKALITCTSYEGFGMSPIEGMISNIPVLCSDLPIFHETIGERVIYFALDNTTDLANKIHAIFAKPDMFVTKLQDAYRWVEDQYSLVAMTQRWKGALQKLGLEKTPPIVKPAIVAPQKVQPKPKVSVCMIVLNEAEYITHTLRQIYNWDCCHEIIIVEGSVALYPRENLAPDGLSGDGTTALIKAFPDPEKKIVYVSGTFADKVAQRNEYAKRVTGTHVLVLDADEFYTNHSLDLLAEDLQAHPDTELFTFNFSANLSERTYYHLWYSFKQHVIGGYWNIPHNRIYKWASGTKYTGEDHNHPTKVDGTKLQHQFVKAVSTKAICIHTGFVKSVTNQKDKNDFYVNRGEGKEKDPKIRARRQMYVDCRRAYETWKPGVTLPHDAQVLSFNLALPESLLDHPYMSDPKFLLNEKTEK